MMLPFARPYLPCLVAVLAAGCGESLHGAYLSEYAPTFPEPDRPVLEIRWFAGYELGTYAPCQPHPASARPALAQWDLGLAGIDVPPDLEPTVWADGGSWRYALGQVLLVEGGGPQRRTSELFPLDGVWGLADLELILVAEGDVAALERDLQIARNSDGHGLVEGIQLIDPGRPDRASQWTSDLSVPDRGADLGQAEAIWVSHLSYVFGPARDMATGAGPGGITFEDCGE